MSEGRSEGLKPAALAAGVRAEGPQVHSSFYRFVPLADALAVAERLRSITVGVFGNILVAPEGITAAIAAPAERLAQFERDLQEDPVFAGAFQGIAFKHSPCEQPPFTLIKVHVKPELVAFGLPEVSGLHDARHTHVSPQEWQQLLSREDVVVIDNRNHFEWKLGRFKNAIDPGVRHFRDFPDYVQAHAADWQREGKTVAMYCTGGIRCEKMSGWMQDLGLKVAQLDGGILNYFKEMGGQDWEGECFVFDKRIAIDASLRETASTADDVWGDEPDEAWRLARAKRLDPQG